MMQNRKPILMKIFDNDKQGRNLFSFLAFIVVYVALSNLFLPEGSFFYMSSLTVILLGKYLAFALLALSLDLIWGYLGILSLGHGAFFSLGAYVMGMYLVREASDHGAYGGSNLPNFMSLMNLQELPWFWHGFNNIYFTLFMVALVPATLAFVFGWFAFKSRVTGVYLSIITQAMTYALMLAFFTDGMELGGNGGLTGFKDILGFSLQADSTRVALLIISFLALVGGYLLSRFIVKSKLGRVCVAIRDTESRTRFLGYKVEQYKLFIFVVSAVLAGFAGALYVPQVGIINPSMLSPLFSIEIVIWVAIGGRGTLFGAIIGAVIVNLAKSYFTSAFPEVWLYILGALFVVSTLYLPKGIVGISEKIKFKKVLLRGRE